MSLEKMELGNSAIDGADTVILFQGIPISQYSLSETQIVQNLDSPDWLLRKLLFFGSAIASIRNLEHLVPGPIANTVFGSLVLLVREFYKLDDLQIRSILTNPGISRIRPLVISNCGSAEYFLEAFYAARIISGQILLEEFPYYENYQLLMSFESKCLQAYIGSSKYREISNVAFIGSGPLPLSSIELIQHLPRGAKVMNFDLCDEAIVLGESIVRLQNLSHRISFSNAAALEIQDLTHVDVVYLAALAGGSNFEKREITEHLHKIMKPGSVLVARSASGLRSFIYEKLTESDFGKFKSFRHFDPTNKVIINSIAVGMKLDF